MHQLRQQDKDKILSYICSRCHEQAFTPKAFPNIHLPVQFFIFGNIERFLFSESDLTNLLWKDAQHLIPHRNCPKNVQNSHSRSIYCFSLPKILEIKREVDRQGQNLTTAKQNALTSTEEWTLFSPLCWKCMWCSVCDSIHQTMCCKNKAATRAAVNTLLNSSPIPGSLYLGLEWNQRHELYQFVCAHRREEELVGWCLALLWCSSVQKSGEPLMVWPVIASAYSMVCDLVHHGNPCALTQSKFNTGCLATGPCETKVGSTVTAKTSQD